MKTLHFRVKIGFEPNDYLSIGADEYSKAVRAQIKKSVVIFKDNGSVSGANIISVLPDWNKELGYNNDYAINGEDMNEIPRIRQSQYREFTAYEGENVERQIQGLPPLEKLESENPVRTHTQGMTQIGSIIEKRK
jgi:hypothetical protein